MTLACIVVVSCRYSDAEYRGHSTAPSPPGLGVEQIVSIGRPNNSVGIAHRIFLHGVRISEPVIVPSSSLGIDS